MDNELHRLTLEIRALMAVLAKISRQKMEQRLQAEGLELSHLQWVTLRTLDFEGAHTITDLGRKLMMDPSTFVPSVDAMERRGWVCRMRDPNDRRRVPISLTAAGKAVLSRVDTIADDDPGYLALQQMGADKARQLVVLLQELVHYLPDGSHIYQMIQAHLQALSADDAQSAPPEA